MVKSAKKDRKSSPRRSKKPKVSKKKPVIRVLDEPTGWKFSSGSMTQCTTPIVQSNLEVQVRPPVVLYSDRVWAHMNYIIEECPKEVGWLGLVDFQEEFNIYLITDLYLPKQKVHGTETDIIAEEIAALHEEITEAGKNADNLYYWGHSHVNMGVSPSGTDEKQIAEYLIDCPVFLRGIYNKKGDIKMDVYQRDEGVVYQCVDNMPESQYLTDAEKEMIDDIIEENVEEQTWTNQRVVYPERNNNPSYKTPGPAVQPALSSDDDPDVSDYMDRVLRGVGEAFGGVL